MLWMGESTFCCALSHASSQAAEKSGMMSWSYGPGGDEGSVSGKTPGTGAYVGAGKAEKEYEDRGMVCETVVGGAEDEDDSSALEDVADSEELDAVAEDVVEAEAAEVTEDETAPVDEAIVLPSTLDGTDEGAAELAKVAAVEGVTSTELATLDRADDSGAELAALEAADPTSESDTWRTSGRAAATAPSTMSSSLLVKSAMVEGRQARSSVYTAQVFMYA